MDISTLSDKTIDEWAIDDDVVRLREWATDIVRPLPQPPIDECTVGVAETCAIRIDDRSGRVSRLHARLVRDQGKWLLQDKDSKNGIWLDGSRRREITLEPGAEIGVGGITLVAESKLSIALRSFLARLVGWGKGLTEIVDQALRSVRMAATRRAALVLCGDGDLVPVARSFHRRTLGLERPFILCDPRRHSDKETVRSAENHVTGLEALATAAGGSVCVRTRRLPADFWRLVQELRNPGSRVQLIVCAPALEECERCRVTPILIPSLSDRRSEISRIIEEYAEDAITELAAPRSSFPPVDHTWVREHASSSLAEIETATLRLVALRTSRNVSHAAARLGMAAVSLSRWIGRRILPIDSAR